MAKTREQKEAFVKELSEQLTSAKGTVFTKYEGLTVHELEELRAKLREEGSRLMMAKKTLLEKALKDAKLAEETDVREFDGAVGVVMGLEDEVAPAKVLDTFAKDHEQVTFYGGLLDGEYISADRVKALAKLPSRPELLAKVVGSINAPVSGFVNVLSGTIRNLVGVMKAIEDKKSNA